MDDLESLIQSVSNAPLVVSPAAFCSTSPSSRDHSGVNAQEHRVTFLVNAEAVLRWPVFESISIQPSPYQSSAAQDDYHSPGLSIPVDLDLQSGGHFIERFFEDVHIFNPVLEEQDVIEYLGEVQRNGIGWDAKSCLMVTIHPCGYPYLLPANPILATDLCSWFDINTVREPSSRDDIVRLPPIPQFFSRRVVFSKCTETPGNAAHWERGHRGSVLFSRRCIPDDNPTTDGSVANVCTRSSLLSSPAKP